MNCAWSLPVKIHDHYALKNFSSSAHTIKLDWSFPLLGNHLPSKTLLFLSFQIPTVIERGNFLHRTWPISRKRPTDYHSIREQKVWGKNQEIEKTYPRQKDHIQMAKRILPKKQKRKRKENQETGSQLIPHLTNKRKWILERAVFIHSYLNLIHRKEFPHSCKWTKHSCLEEQYHPKLT